MSTEQLSAPRATLPGFPAPRPLVADLLALAAYAALTLVMTWPLVLHLGSELAGARSDLWVHQWTFWWIKQALQTGQSPFYTTLLYYPYGVSLTSHNIAWFNIALWLPLQALFGAVTAYNLVFIIVITLNGFAFYLFARAETSAGLPAFVGGLIFGFWPYTLSHYDHPNMMVTFWVPLTLLFMLKSYRHGRLRDTLLMAVCMAMVGITRWQLLVMSAPIILAYGLYLFYREPQPRPWHRASRFLAAGLLAALIMAPLAAPLVLDQLGRSGPEAVAVEEPDAAVTDLFAYVAPPDLYRRIWADAPDPLPYPEWEPYHRIAASAYYVPFVGLATLALVVYGLWRQWRRTWFWLLLALILILFALGPELAVNGRRFVQMPMPYRLLDGTLIDALIRRPHRLNNFLGLPLAMIASWGMVDLFGRLRGGRRPWLLAPAAGLLSLLILRAAPIPPLPLTNTPVPLWYQDLAAEEGDFGILELPFHNRGFDKLYMYYQTVHGKPIATGHVSRLPQDAFRFIESVPFLQPFNSIYTWNVVAESWVDFDDVDVSRQMALLREAGIRYVVLNKPLIAPGFIERWRDWITFAPRYEDDEVLVYSTDPRHGREFAIEQPLADGIGLLHARFGPEIANQGGILTVDLRWGTDSAPQTDYNACLSLADAAGRPVLLHCLPPVDDWPTSEWGGSAVARGAYQLSLPGDLSPGVYRLYVALVDAASGTRAGQGVDLGQVTVQAVAPQTATELCWLGRLCLLGFDSEQSGDQLELTLYWQAAQTPGLSYKRFVHLVDPQDGRVVAQSDDIPRDWTYPTDIWVPGEIVVDSVSLPLENIPGGDYLLRGGWYAVDGGQALPAFPDEACDCESAESLTLGEVTLP